MVGLQSLAPGQAPMPGQGQMAGQPAMPGMLPKPQGVQPGVPALVPSLVGMDMGRLLQMFADPNNPVPKNRILAAMTEKQKEMAARQAVQGQMAMAQAQQQPGTIKDQVVQGAMQAAQAPQMAAHGGVMRGYAGGGAVAFQSGGNMLVEQILKKSPYERTPEENEILRAAGVEVTRKSLPQEGGVSALNRLLEAPFIRRMFTGDTYKLSPEELAKRTDTGATTERIFRALGGNQFVEPTVAPAAAEQSTDTGDELARLLGRAPAPVLMRDTRGAAPTPPAPSGGQRRQPVATPRSGLGALASPVEQTGTPAPDALSSIEAEARAQSEGLQKLLAAQGQVDPRIIAARKEAAELAQRGISEREKRAAGALEAAGMPLSQSLLDNQEALFRMLGAMKGGKRLGDAFSSIGQEAGAIRGEQRKALETARRENLLEQNALDRLREAQAELKLAQTTNDVTGERAAALKVEEAKANLINTRLNIQKERAAEADRAEQREIQRRTAGAQEKTAEAAMIGAKARAEGAGARGVITPKDLAKFRMQAEQQVDKALETDAAYRRLRNDPTAQAAYREDKIKARVREALVAADYDLPAGYEKPAAPAGAATRLRFDAQGNPIK